MSRPATSRLKINPPLGRMPALQYALPGELQVDETYQRSLENESSKSLVNKIAQFWNWDLCQPLVVARRSGGELFVIDGQHRLQAAKLRGDITQIPCVIVEYTSVADEAASFVHLNQQRRPLSAVDVFKAAVASEDPVSMQIAEALGEAGLTLATHSNNVSWKPGMVNNISGIQACWRERGPRVTKEALILLAEAYRGSVLQYGGTIFPGLATVVHRGLEYDREQFLQIIRKHSQLGWRNELLRYQVENPNTSRREAAGLVFMAAWRGQSMAPEVASVPIDWKPIEGDRMFCEQCDRPVGREFANACRSRFCSLRKGA